MTNIANLFTTTRCQVVQFLPSISILEQFESILVTYSPTDFISSSLWWSSSLGLELFTIAPLSCLPIRSTIQRIFEHFLPCRRTTPPPCRGFLTSRPFLFLQQKNVIRTLCAVQAFVSFGCIPKTSDQEML